MKGSFSFWPSATQTLQTGVLMEVVLRVGYAESQPDVFLTLAENPVTAKIKIFQTQ